MTRTVCGFHRKLCRNDILAILIKQGLNQSELARKIGVTPESVSSTLLGKKHCPQVLDGFRKYGVPEEYLFDPQKVA